MGNRRPRRSQAGTPAESPTAPAAATDQIPNDPAAPMLRKAYELVTKKDFDGALNIVDEAVKNNPRSFAALTLRGMIYSQKKQWTSADADFNAALAHQPRQHGGEVQPGRDQVHAEGLRGRAGPVRSHDQGSGDGRFRLPTRCSSATSSAAMRRRPRRNSTAGTRKPGPSYFFGMAAWDFVHNDQTDAASYLTSAANIFPASKNQFYAASLQNLGYLPLKSADAVTFRRSARARAAAPLRPAPRPARPA